METRLIDKYKTCNIKNYRVLKNKIVIVMTLRDEIYKYIPPYVSLHFNINSIEDILESFDKLYSSPCDIVPETEWTHIPKSGDDLSITSDTSALIKTMSDNLKELAFCIKYHNILTEKIKENITTEKARRNKTSIYKYIYKIQRQNFLFYNPC